MTTTIHVMQQPYLQHSMWNGIKSSCLHDLHELSRLLNFFSLNSEYYIAVLEEEERYYTVSWTLDTESIVFLQ